MHVPVICVCLNLARTATYVALLILPTPSQRYSFQVHDMIAGGQVRARWADEDGEKALEAIHAQRTVTDIVRHHRTAMESFAATRNSYSKSSRRSTDAPLDGADAELPAGSSEAGAVAKLAAAEAVKYGYTRRQYKSRRRQFRKVCLKSAVPSGLEQVQRVFLVQVNHRQLVCY